jgi:tripartite-type tricarboxylate transporter receptor subunit TctC
MIKAGKLRAVGTIRKRSPLMPDVPALQEQGYDIDFQNWNAVFFQRGVPDEAVRRWNAELNKIVRDPKFEGRFLAPASLSASGGTPEELAQIVRKSRATAAELVRLAKLKLK